MRTSLIALTVLWPLAIHAQAPVPVDQEPRHRVVLTDSAMRVIDVNVPAGDTTLEHSHAHDIATVCIESSRTRTREPGQAWGDARPRAVGAPNLTEYAGKPGAHTLQNVGAGPYRLIAVENRRTSGWSAAPPVVAHATTVAREARAFRLYDVVLGAGATKTTHFHATPTVAILITGSVSASGNGGSAARHLRAPGEWVQVPPGEPHSISALGSPEARVTEIELR
jgi:quercetin dioxygenase-like cupin family protein